MLDSLVRPFVRPGDTALGGYLLVETSERQAPQTVEAFARNGLNPRVASSGKVNAPVVIGVGRRLG